MELKPEILKESGAVSFGAVPFSCLEDSMTEAMKRKLTRVCPWAKTVISFVFPYRLAEEGNLAAFARGRDYHIVIKEELNALCRKLGFEYAGGRFLAFADDAPFPEVLAAYFSGAGALGKNGLISYAPYGSAVLLGEIVTDLEIYRSGGGAYSCLGCGRCLDECPTGALKIVNGRRVLDKSRCVSMITQKKGELSERDAEIIRNSAYVWGCDECVKACPKSSEPAGEALHFGPIDKHIHSLELRDVEGLSNEEFIKKYPERSFTYRGVSPIYRNLLLKKVNNTAPKQE